MAEIVIWKDQAQERLVDCYQLQPMLSCPSLSHPRDSFPVKYVMTIEAIYVRLHVNLAELSHDVKSI